MAGEIYIGSLGTVKTIRDTGGDSDLTFGSLGVAALQVGVKLDLGDWPRTRTYRWSCGAQWNTAPSANRSLDLYYSGWDNEASGGSIDIALVGATNSSITATKRYNMAYLGSIRIESSAVGPFVGGGLVDIPYRYISVAAFNDGSTVLATAATYASVLRLTPVIEQIQS